MREEPFSMHRVKQSSRLGQSLGASWVWRRLWSSFVTIAIAVRIQERGGDSGTGPHNRLYELSLTWLSQVAAPRERVLEVGCGFGYGSRIVSAKGYEMVCCDPDRRPLLAFPAGMQGPSLVQSRGEDLPFKSGSFDAAISIETLEHCPLPSRMLRELARVVKPGGGLFLTSPEGGSWGIKHSRYHLHEWNLDELRAALGGSGWKVEGWWLLDQASDGGGTERTILERLSFKLESLGIESPLPSRLTCVVFGRLEAFAPVPVMTPTPEAREYRATETYLEVGRE